MEKTLKDSLPDIKESIFNFWIDYLEVYWEFNWVRELAKGLDADNSNFSHFEDFTVTFDNNIRNYEYKLTFFKENVPCFWVYRWVKINEFVETKDYICFYWSAFRVLWEKYILDFIRDNIAFEKAKRFDLCLDLTLPIKDILTEFKDIKQTWSKFFWAGGNIETVYIGQKKRTNKQTLIRIYNKIADIYAKEKQRLLAEYLQHEHVTRIEIEFREEISCNIDFESFYDREYLLHTFYSYIAKHTSIFNDMEYERVILKRLQKSFDPEWVKTSRMIWDKYRKMFKSYATKILRNSCPVDILLRNDLISETTLWDIVLSIQDWKLDLEFYRLWATVRNAKQVFADVFESDWLSDLPEPWDDWFPWIDKTVLTDE